MAVRYIYNGQKYLSLYLLRQAIWENEHILYSSPQTQEEFDADPLLTGKVVFEEYDPWAELDDQSKAARIRARRDEKLMERDFYIRAILKRWKR